MFSSGVSKRFENVVNKVQLADMAGKVKEARGRLSLSQAALAKAMGRSTGWIGEIESGRSWPPVWLLSLLYMAGGFSAGGLLADLDSVLRPKSHRLQMVYHLMATGLRPPALRYERLSYLFLGLLVTLGVRDWPDNASLWALSGEITDSSRDELIRLSQESNLYLVAAGAIHAAEHLDRECSDSCRDDWPDFLERFLAKPSDQDNGALFGHFPDF